MNTSTALGASLDKEEARKLIFELRAHQTGEIECLRKLYGLSDEAGEARVTKETDNRATAHPGPGASGEGITITTYPIPPTLGPRLDPFHDRNSLEKRMVEIRKILSSEGSDRASEWILKQIFPEGGDDTFMRVRRMPNRGFRIKDLNRGGIILDTERFGDLEKMLVAQLQNVLYPDIQGREIEINEFTPNTLVVLLVIDHIESTGLDGALETLKCVFNTLRKHLNGAASSPDVYLRDFTDMGIGASSDGNQTSFRQRIFSFTVPYFKVYGESEIKQKVAPLTESGAFGRWLDRNKIIRQERFSVVFFANTRYLTSPGFPPAAKSMDWKLVALAPRANRSIPDYPYGGTGLAQWVVKNLREISNDFQEVLSELDRQISIDSTIIFKEEARNKLLFEDENFSNSKKHFWALQSLRVFSETVPRIRQNLHKIFEGFEVFGEDLDKDWEKKTLKDVTSEYEMLEKRIKEKRVEIEGLSNGLFSASSVIEARLAASQNNNIRLLTLVTIAFLPLSFVTSIFSMSVLPESVTLGTFFVTIVITTVITFAIVFNLRNADRALYDACGSLTRDIQHSMKNDPKGSWVERSARLKQAEELRRAETPVSNWWYVGYLLYNPGILLRKLWRKRSTCEDKDPEIILGTGNGNIESPAVFPWHGEAGLRRPRALPQRKSRSRWLNFW